MAGENGNYWPGFVDALSNMVMAMIFLILTFMAVIFTVMQNNSKNLQNKVEQAEHAAASYQKTIDQLKHENEILKSASKRCSTIQTAGETKVQSLLTADRAVNTDQPYVDPATKAGNLPVSVSGQGAMITIGYRATAVTLDATAKSNLDAVVAKDGVKPDHAHVSIVAEIASDTSGPSEAQRLAYFRGLDVRNYFLAHGWTGHDVDMTLAARAKSGAAPRVLVRFASK